MSLSAGVAYIDVIPDMKNFGSSVEKGLSSSSVTGATQKSGGKLGGILSSGLAKAAAGVFVAKQGFDFLSSAISDAEAANASVARLSQTLDSMGRNIPVEKLTATADALESTTGFSAEAIQSGQALLSTFGNLSDKFINDLTPSVVDFAAQFTGGNIDGAATMLGKALDNPIKGLSALSRVGVSFTDQQTKMIQKMVEAGDVAGAQGLIMEAVQPQIAGVAEAGFTASAKLGVVWGKIKEGIGQIVLPLFTKFVDGISEGIKWITALWDALGGGEGVLNSLADAFRPLLEAGQKVWEFFKDDLLGVWQALVDVYNQNLKPALSNLMGAFQSLKPVLKVIITVYVALQAIILKVALKVLPIIIRVLGFLIQAISKVIQTVAGAIRMFGSFVGAVIRAVQGAYNAVKTWLTNAGAFIYDTWAGIIEFFRGLPSKLASAASGMWNWLSDGVTAAINTVIGLLNEGIGFINRFQIHIHVDPPGPGSINFDWNGPGIPTIPTLAEGGIVTRPTLAIIGEAGPEAVVPLGNRNNPLSGARIQIVDSNLGVVMTGVVLDELDRDRQFDQRRARAR